MADPASSLFAFPSSGSALAPPSSAGLLPPQFAAYRNATAPLPSPPPFSSDVRLQHAQPSSLPEDEDDEYYLALARRKQAHSHSSFPHHVPSPGQGIRRLAESFLDSLGDEGEREAGRDYERGGVLEGMERKRREVDEMLLMMARRADAPRGGLDGSPPSFASTGSSTSSPSVSRPSSNPADQWASLHQEIIHFAQTCQQLQQQQSALRDDLSQRTRRAVKSVWPTAEVDLVGSVAAGVALPKSDVDFVVFFPVTRDTDPRPAYTYSAPLNEDGHATLDAASISRQQAEFSDQFSSSTSTASLSSTPPSSSPATTPSTSPLSSHAHLVYHFAHAGSLIKLLGGRKKSKLLFRSTKIQVFKDINLIRLRDGCSGISMDLWFPTSSFVTVRSQQHTLLITSFLTAFPFFYPLSVVVKSFMQQQMLNSGYSGLGSYGVLLMIVRFLQHQRDQSRRSPRADGHEGVKEGLELPPAADVTDKERTASATSTSSTASLGGGEGNLGRALCEFFRFYCTFDYATKAIDVRGDGAFFDKPELAAIVKKGKGQGAGGPGADDEDDGDAASDDEAVDKQPDGDWQSGATAGAPATSGAEPADAAQFTQYTLVIQDPLDTSNLIVGHHRALRNMVQAFMKALTILDADSPLPVVPAALMTPVVAPASVPPSTITASLAASSTSAMFHSQYALPPSSSMGRTTSDIVYPSSLVTLPSHFPAATSGAPQPSMTAVSGLTPFQRLLDVNAAYAGPAMKECPDARCRSLNPPTLCPIQNKVCFTCGFMFIKVRHPPLTQHQHHRFSALHAHLLPALCPSA